MKTKFLILFLMVLVLTLFSISSSGKEKEIIKLNSNLDVIKLNESRYDLIKNPNSSGVDGFGNHFKTKYTNAEENLCGEINGIKVTTNIPCEELEKRKTIESHFKEEPEEKIDEKELIEEVRDFYQTSEPKNLPGEENKFKCGTPLLKRIYRKWDKLSEETKQEIESILSKPDLPLTHTTTHFTIHYTTSGEHATDFIYIGKLANALEHSWSTEVDSFGFDQPPDSMIDVYVYDLPQGIGGQTYKIPITNIGIDIDIDRPDGELQKIVAHEFFHAVQLSYDWLWLEPDWVGEGTAVWMQDAVYDKVGYNYYVWYYLWQDTPYRSLMEMDYDAVLFWKYFSEKWGTNGEGTKCWEVCDDSDCGVDIIKAVWIEEGYGMGGVSQVLKDWYNLSFPWAFEVWTEVNYIKDLGNPYGDGYYDYCEDEDDPYYPTTWIRGSKYLSVGETETFPTYDVDSWAANYLILIPQSDVGIIEVNFNGQNSEIISAHDFGLILLFIKNNEVKKIHYQYLDSNNDANFSQDTSNYDTIVFIIHGREYGGNYDLSVKGLPPEINCDVDEDGYISDSPQCGGNDCNDYNININPGAAENCYDGLDNDCDGKVDDDDPDCGAICECTSWTAGSCGGGICASSERQYTRTCSPSGCDVEEKCEYDSSCTHGITRYVCKSGCQYDNIEDAVEASNRLDRVVVTDKGTYYEDQIRWPEAVAVILDCQGATLDGQNIDQEAIKIQDKNTQIEEVTIKNCNFKNYNYPAIVVESKNYYLSYVYIENNTFINNKEGIYVRGKVYHSKFADNIFKFNKVGIELRRYTSSKCPRDNEISHNIFNENKEKAIYLYDTQVGDNKIQFNTINNNKGYGIYIESFGYNLNTYIENNTISNNSYGLYIKNAENNIINHNTFCLPNINYDLSISGSSNSGTGNKCDKPTDWNDSRATGCTYTCCSNECSEGEKICLGAYSQTCGDYDDDPCLEWPSSTEGDGNEDCGESYCENWGENYCKDGDVYKNRTCHDKGCSNGDCYDDSYEEARLVTTCPCGCGNGACITSSADINYDFKVDIFDLATVGLCYGCMEEQECWTSEECYKADLSRNGKVDIFDLAKVGLNYGREC